MAREEGKFKVIKITDFSEFKEGLEIPESDLTLQTEKNLIQLEYKEGKSEIKKKTIKTGCYSFADTSMGIVLEKFELKEYALLKSVQNTKFITDESEKFFRKVNEGVYSDLKKEPKRALLLASPPGIGKTAAINSVCKHYLSIEGTAVLIWDTASVKSSSINKFFLSRSKFDSDVKRMIMIIEDIGGGSIEADHSQKAADTSLLNLLDGVGSPFAGVPTFIIATTNNPEQSVAALIDRPGRFDKVQTMQSPNEEECKELLKFISKLDDKQLEERKEEIESAAKISAKAKFSIAHLQEIIVRSRIDDIDYVEAAGQLAQHRKDYADGFKSFAEGKKTGRKGMGLSSRDY